MRISLHRLIQKDAPRAGVIKYWTHAAGMTVIALVVPSICAFYVRYLGVEDGEPSWVRTAYGVWYAHAGFVVLTAVLWLIEKPRYTRFVTTESDMVDWPKEKNGPIQSPQNNAGSRPSSSDSPVSETPSAPAPRG